MPDGTSRFTDAEGKEIKRLGHEGAPLVWWFRGWLVFVATWVLGFLKFREVFDISLKEFKMIYFNLLSDIRRGRPSLTGQFVVQFEYQII